MASTFEGDGIHVLLTCSCSALSPAARLYFCRHCIKLRCPLCVSHEVVPRDKGKIIRCLTMINADRFILDLFCI